MPRYFLHMKQGARLVRDHEGSMLASREEAHTEAIEAAREICAEAVKNGKEVAADAFIIVDEAGSQIAFLPITESLPMRLRRTESEKAGERPTSDIVVNLTRQFEAACSTMLQADHLQAEIRQQFNSCAQAVRDIRKKLSAF
jgi:hypothetical protein